MHSTAGDFHRRGFTTDMTELDIVYGGEERLAATVREVVAAEKPAAVFVYATCVTGLIGEDIEAACAKLSSRAVAAGHPGATRPASSAPRTSATASPARRCSSTSSAPPSPPCTTPDRHHAHRRVQRRRRHGRWSSRCSRECGIRVLSHITGNARFEEIRYAHRAKALGGRVQPGAHQRRVRALSAAGTCPPSRCRSSAPPRPLARFAPSPKRSRPPRPRRPESPRARRSGHRPPRGVRWPTHSRPTPALRGKKRRAVLGRREELVDGVARCATSASRSSPSAPRSRPSRTRRRSARSSATDVRLIEDISPAGHPPPLRRGGRRPAGRRRSQPLPRREGGLAVRRREPGARDTPTPATRGS